MTLESSLFKITDRTDRFFIKLGLPHDKPGKVRRRRKNMIKYSKAYARFAVRTVGRLLSVDD